MYAYLHAKIRAKLSRMLSADDIEALAGADLDTLLQRLKGTSYAAQIIEAEDARISDRLGSGMLADVATLLMSLGGKDRDLIISVLARFRVENLETIISAHIRRVPADKVKEYVFTLPWEQVDYFRLLGLPGIDALIKELPWPNYQRALAAVHRQVGDKEVTFPYDVELDALYLQQLLSQYKWQGADVKEILKNRIMREIFSWAFRLKGYGFSFPETINLLPDFRPLISQEEMRGIVEDAEGWRGITRYLSSERTDLKLVEEFSADRMEQLFDADLLRVVGGAFVTSPFGLGIVVGYIYLKELELARLVELVERARVRR